MKVVLCGGGTGGHVYPALTVAAALKQRAAGREPLDLLYIGVRGKIDRELVEREGIPFRAIDAGPLRVGSAGGVARGGLKLAAGTAEALGILRGFRPDAVFATGGYGSAGVGLAASMLRLPLALFLPDVEAGLAIKTLVRLARRIAVSVPPALGAMPHDKTRLTGYPVRAEFFEADRESARRELGLDPVRPLLLVAGGSTGATRISRAVTDWLADFLETGQVLHVCGAADEGWLRERRAALPSELRECYHLYAYLHGGMAQAMAAADVAVMRSGASTLGELPATRLPAVLVPGEYESGSNQIDNATYLDEQGAAIMLRQDRIGELQATLMGLLNDRERREGMRQKLASLSRPEAAGSIAALIEEMAGHRAAAPEAAPADAGRRSA